MSVIYDPTKQNPKRTPRRAKPSRRKLSLPRPRVKKPSWSLPDVSWRLVVGVVLLLAVFAGAGWWASHRATDDDTARVAAISPENELVKPIHAYLTAADAKANLPLNFSFVAPKAWRSTRLPATASTSLHPSDYQIGAFSFTAGSDSLDPNGQMTIENITSWLGSDDNAKATTYAGLKTKAQKQSAISDLIGLRRSRAVNPSDSTLIKINGETGSKRQLQYVNSADGKLSGIIYVVDISTQGAKSQHIIGLMAGVIDGQTVYTRLDIPVNDDPNKIYGQATDLLKSLTFDTSARSPQAPAVSK